MELYDLNRDFISSETSKKIESPCPSNDQDILCNHCKRTTTNGIRCLGMCVADNDY